MTLDAHRGRIVPPDLDDRTWQELVDEMRRLIPQYAPGWTDHNPSDLGITLIELFAWLAEGVIYRLNRTPEKHYLSFLQLLGVTRDPPRPATTYLTFTAGGAAVDVPAGTQAQTAAAGGASPVVFETDEDVRVLPTSLRSAVLVGPHAAGAASARYEDVTTALVGPPAAKYLLTVPPDQTVEICFGFDRKVAVELPLRFRLYQPVRSTTPPTVTWVCSRANTGPLAWTAVAGAVDGTEGLRHDGTVRLTPPADWTAQRPTLGPGDPPPAWAGVTAGATAPVTDLRFWIAARVKSPPGTPIVVGIERALFNAARASTALTIRVPEELGESTGEPFQSFLLQNRPLHRRPGPDPYGHLVVEVGQGPPTSVTWEEWALADDLPAGPGKVHRVQPVVGEVMFGNHDSRPGAATAGGDVAHGAIPPAGSRVRARTYRYVAAGARGNVAADQVTSPGSSPAGATLSGLTVTNLGPGVDGTDEEPLDDALRRAPEELKIRDRAVTADDHEFLAREAADLHIVRCLAARLHAADGPANTWKKNDAWNFAGLLRAPGHVHVVIVPDLGPTVARPEPTEALRTEVQAYLDARRDLGGSLGVVDPRYLPVAVKLDLVVWKQALDAGATEEAVRADALARIHAFLHPTTGGPSGQGWRVGEGVFASDVFRAVRPPDEIGFVAGLLVKPLVPLYHFPPLGSGASADDWTLGERPFALPTDFGPSVRVADYELVCSADSAAHVVKSTVQQS